MPIDAAKLARMERELAEAQTQFLQEDGERYRILMREISDVEKQRILDSLTDTQERILFGLEAPVEPKRRGRPAGQGKEAGKQVCPICGKGGFSQRGLKLHMIRMHPERSGAEAASS